MRIVSLRIENFRGIREGFVLFAPHTVFVGANNCGKTTVLEALALLFGRDRMVRSLTEHDFFGSDPQPQDRIRLVATLAYFDGDDPAQHLDWFRDGRGIPKWWDATTSTVHPQRTNAHWKLACQVSFAARFHRPSLEVETVRHFHDDDAAGDVFDDEIAIPFPTQLVRDIGLYLVPASRTWDRTLSFGSELFRRVIAAGQGQPSASVLAERDRLREPEARLEEDQNLAPIVARLNEELRGFFRATASLHLRVTATDSDALLEAVVPHYAHGAEAHPLPARRHGSGLLSLQHLLLLLQFGRLRAENHEGFWMALEEPELHVPPALQRRLVGRIQSLSTQTFVTTHSPLIAALSDPQGVAVLRNSGGALTSVPLLRSTLPAETPNSVRKLFQVNRVDTIAALMHDFVLVPEGRTDFEWLGLLARAVALHQSWAAPQDCSFDPHVGVVPTHDGAVVATVSALTPLHPRIAALVDGDVPGIGYADELVQVGVPNSGVIIRWPNDWTIEDLLGWIIEADPVACLGAIDIAPAATTAAELVVRLKSENRAAHGLKKDTSAYEAVANAIGDTQACRQRVVALLNAITAVLRGQATPHFVADSVQQAIWIFQP